MIRDEKNQSTLFGQHVASVQINLAQNMGRIRRVPLSIYHSSNQKLKKQHYLVLTKHRTYAFKNIHHIIKYKSRTRLQLSTICLFLRKI